jgi:hypothetical protein
MQCDYFISGKAAIVSTPSHRFRLLAGLDRLSPAVDLPLTFYETGSLRREHQAVLRIRLHRIARIHKGKIFAFIPQRKQIRVMR